MSKNKPTSDRYKHVHTEEFMKKRLAGVNKYWSDPENRKRRSELSKAYWSDPENRKKASKRKVKFYKDPDNRQKKSKGMVKYYKRLSKKEFRRRFKDKPGKPQTVAEKRKVSEKRRIWHENAPVMMYRRMYKQVVATRKWRNRNTERGRLGRKYVAYNMTQKYRLGILKYVRRDRKKIQKEYAPRINDYTGPITESQMKEL